MENDPSNKLSRNQKKRKSKRVNRDKKNAEASEGAQAALREFVIGQTNFVRSVSLAPAPRVSQLVKGLSKGTARSRVMVRSKPAESSVPGSATVHARTTPQVAEPPLQQLGRQVWSTPHV
jgi:hypothetical protein